MRRSALWIAASVMTMLVVGTPVSAEVRRLSYPAVKVELAPAYKPDAVFETFRAKFSDAVAKKDATALFALVAPGFVWTQNNNLTSEFDPGRDAQHNFRVVFGFRALGKDVDGEVENGPFWDALAVFANDGTYSQSADGKNLVCSPATASIVDEAVFEQARAKIEMPEEGAAWYFILGSAAVARAPDDRGAPMATLAQEAVPVLRTHPSSEEGKPATAPAYYEVLLPSGRTGWIPANTARSFQADRLCYAQTAQGEWKIAIYDSAE